MEKLGLGQLIHGEQCRDAIHIAVAPVTAAEDLNPGVHIGFVKGSSTHVEAATNPIGIVDPYLTTGVQKGQSFWMFLYPNSITSLRHDWTHPSFKNPEVPKTAMAASDKSESEKWLRAFAELAGLSYDRLMEHADDWLRYKEYYVEHNSERMRDAFYKDNNAEDFWKHYCNVTGRDVVEDERESFFSCSC